MTSPLTAQHVLDRAQSLYGAALGAPGGVVHVVSATRAPDGLLHVLAIGPHAPPSDTDFFVLQLCRARADAILSTARILRDEPELSLAFKGPWAEALARYRSEHLGKPELTCAILTASGDVPRAHPIFQESVHKLVLTQPDRKAPVLAALSGLPHVQVETLPSGRARDALDLLHARGLGCLSIEAGPSTAGTLYDPPARVEELFLSLCEAPVDARAVGKALPPDHVLLAGLTLVSDTLSHEESGAWRFRRYVRVSG